MKVAEMTLASAYYTTNKARAAFYPGINITATAGWTNGSGVTVSNPGQFMFRRWLRWHSLSLTMVSWWPT